MKKRNPHNKWVVYLDKNLQAKVKMRALKEKVTVGEFISNLIRKK